MVHLTGRMVFRLGFAMVGEDSECRVSGWNKKDSMLQFEDNLPSGLQVGDAIELLSGEEAPVLGQRLILARAGLSPKEISVTMRLATTRCTNALLEGKGTEPVICNKGFSQSCWKLGISEEPASLIWFPKNAPSCTAQWWRLNERLDRTGEVLQSPDLFGCGIRSP